jgi:hypothetical protein
MHKFSFRKSTLKYHTTWVERPPAFLLVQDFVLDTASQDDWYAAVEALCEVLGVTKLWHIHISFFIWPCIIFGFWCELQILPSLEPVIVYFPDSSKWLSQAVPKDNRKEFVQKLEEMLDKLTGPVVLICGQNVAESEPKEKEKYVRSGLKGKLDRWL